MASHKMTSYARDPLAPLVRWLIAPAWACWERSPYLRYYRRWKQSQFQPADQVGRAQWQSLRSLAEHAYRTTDFYRRRFDSVGMTPADLRSPTDLLSIPVLTKADLRQHKAAMISDAYRGQKLHSKRTSGSTGVSVEVLVDEWSSQLHRGLTVRADEWSGWRLGEPVAAVWGNPTYLKRGWRGRLRNLLLERTRYLDTLKMDEPAIRRFADDLRRKPPAMIFGHAHSLYLFAEFLRKNGGAGFRPKGIISSAMVLHDWERRVIEEVFGTKVTNRYGCEEVSLIACECEVHRGLHINAEGVYVEVLRPDGSAAAPGELGAIVVTDLVNRGMPIIRYQIGDMAVRSDRQCPCGRGLPMLEQIEGRIADYVSTPAGELVSGISLTENFATLIPGLAQIQIIQEALDRFTFRIVRGPDYGADSDRSLEELVLERFGPGVTFAREFVDEIAKEPSGKYRFCISKVPNRFTRLQAAAS